ncbi:MAG: hypothetical protein ACXQS2_05800 [Methermicoccaceae archaeon]
MLLTVMGSGDAAGCPKVGCYCPACTVARKGGRSRRTRFSLLLENNGAAVLVDAGPDIRCQLI